MKKDLVSSNWEILDSYRRKEAFGEQVLSFRVILTRVFFFDMHVENTLLLFDGSQFKIFEDELWQQKLNNG